MNTANCASFRHPQVQLSSRTPILGCLSEPQRGCQEGGGNSDAIAGRECSRKPRQNGLQPVVAREVTPRERL